MVILQGENWQFIANQRRVDVKNTELAKRVPGYRIEYQPNVKRSLEWELYGPDGQVHYRRDTFEAICALTNTKDTGGE